GEKVRLGVCEKGTAPFDLLLERHRQPEIRCTSYANAEKLGRRDAGNGEVNVIDDETLADDVRIAVEFCRPVTITDDCRGLSARIIIFGCEHSPSQRTHTQ